MSARRPTDTETSDIAAVAGNVFDQLQELPYPPHAAGALSIAIAKLTLESENPEIRTEEQVRKFMGEMTEAVVKAWRIIRPDQQEKRTAS